MCLTHLGDIAHDLTQEIGRVWSIRAFWMMETPEDGFCRPPGYLTGGGYSYWTHVGCF